MKSKEILLIQFRDIANNIEYEIPQIKSEKLNSTNFHPSIFVIIYAICSVKVGMIVISCNKIRGNRIDEFIKVKRIFFISGIILSKPSKVALL